MLYRGFDLLSRSPIPSLILGPGERDAIHLTYDKVAGPEGQVLVASSRDPREWRHDAGIDAAEIQMTRLVRSGSSPMAQVRLCPLLQLMSS